MNQTSEGNKLNLNDSGTTQIIRKYVHNIMENRMDKTFALLEFDQIKNTLKTYTHTKQATDMVDRSNPCSIRDQIQVEKLFPCKL